MKDGGIVDYSTVIMAMELVYKTSNISAIILFTPCSGVQDTKLNKVEKCIDCWKTTKMKMLLWKFYTMMKTLNLKPLENI